MTNFAKRSGSNLMNHHMSNYSAIIFDNLGRTLACVAISAENDDAATSQVEAMLEGHGIDLWDGSRFIAHFPPVDRPK